MKLLLGVLLLVGGYYCGLCKLSDVALAQVMAINLTYSSVAAASDKWEQGDMSASLTGR